MDKEEMDGVLKIYGDFKQYFPENALDPVGMKFDILHANKYPLYGIKTKINDNEYIILPGESVTNIVDYNNRCVAALDRYESRDEDTFRNIASGMTIRLIYGIRCLTLALLAMSSILVLVHWDNPLYWLLGWLALAICTILIFAVPDDLREIKYIYWQLKNRGGKDEAVRKG